MLLTLFSLKLFGLKWLAIAKASKPICHLLYRACLTPQLYCILITLTIATCLSIMHLSTLNINEVLLSGCKIPWAIAGSSHAHNMGRLRIPGHQLLFPNYVAKWDTRFASTVAQLKQRSGNLASTWTVEWGTTYDRSEQDMCDQSVCGWGGKLVCNYAMETA